MHQTEVNGRSDTYVPQNKPGEQEDHEAEVWAGEVKYLVAVDDYLDAEPTTPPACPPTQRFAVCNLYKADRSQFSPPGIGMWTGREGHVKKDQVVDVESDVGGKLIRFHIPVGLPQSVYDKQQLRPGEMRWATYQKFSGYTG